MKVGFYVFSGTGNTKKVCKEIEKQLVASGVQTEFSMIKVGEEYSPTTNFDRVVIGYPVHAFNAPTPVLDFLKSLPKSNGCEVYMVKTSGEPLKANDGSCILPNKILKKRGYKVCADFHYVMPYNIIFRHSDAMAARMWRAVTIKVPNDAQAIINGEQQKLPINIFKRMFSFVCRIEHSAMPWIGRRFKTDDNCSGCGKCVKMCPMNNIKIVDGKPAFGKKCIGCMGCAFGCPKDSIYTGMLNGWKVNGDYKYDSKCAEDEEICSYCKKSYLNYFKNIENVLK